MSLFDKCERCREKEARGHIAIDYYANKSCPSNPITTISIFICPNPNLLINMSKFTQWWLCEDCLDKTGNLLASFIEDHWLIEEKEKTK